jgi:predicted TIM-barrel fold metal-dependent hydrolase
LSIVDAQVHIWGPDTPERPWPGHAGSDRPIAPHLPEPLTAETLLPQMDALGIDRVILVSPSWEGYRNDLVLAAAKRYPDRFAAVGRFDIAAPDAREQLERWMQQPGMLGLQLTFQIPLYEIPLLEGRVDWIWPVAEKAGIPIHVYAPHRHLHLFDRAAERHPGLKFVINHFGLTGREKDAAAFKEFDRLLALARRPNIAVKASCMPFYTTEAYPFPSLQPYLRRVYDAFGPKRMFWGTDLSRLPCSWREGMTFFTEEIPWLTPEDKTWIMGRAICAWHGWDLP